MLSARARLKLARYATVAIALVAIAAALHIAAIAVVPVVGALALTAMFWPLQQWFSRFVPRWLAAGVCTGLMILAVALVAGWGWYAITNATDEFDGSRQKYAQKYRDMRSWLTERGVPESAVPKLSNVPIQHADGESASTGNGEASGESSGRSLLAMLPEESRQWLGRLATGGLRTMAGVLASVLLTIFLAYLALFEGERWIDWANRHLTSHRYRAMQDLVQRLSLLTRRYFLGKAITGVITGAATWVLLAIMGVPLAGVWGVFTFFMNFIPNIGALISGVPPTLLALGELGLTQAIIVAIGLLLIETLAGNVLDPMLQGRFLNISSFVVLASLVVWGWAWGIAGAILAPVLTASIYTIAKRGKDLMEHEAGIDRRREGPAGSTA